MLFALAVMGAATGVAKSAVVTDTWVTGDTTGPWNSTSLTTDWKTAAYPNGNNYIATAGKGSLTTLTANATVGEIYDTGGSGAGWNINGSGYTFTMDASGFGTTTNLFGDTAVAAIDNAYTANIFTVMPSLLIANTDLDLGSTSQTTGELAIGVQGVTTINNSGNTGSATAAHNLFLKGIETQSHISIAVSSAVGTTGAPIAIQDLSAGYVYLNGALGPSVTTVESSDTAGTGSRLYLTSTGNAYTGNTIIDTGAYIDIAVGAGQVIPYGSGKGNIVTNGTFEIGGNSQFINGLTGTGVITNTSAGGSGGNTSTITLGNGDTTATFQGTVAGTAGRYIDITKVGVGTQILNSSANTINAVTISAGTLQIGDGTGSTAIVGNAISSTGAVTGAVGVNDNANLAFNYNAAATVPNAISGTGSVTQIGVAPLTLNAASSFSGGLNISSSSVVAGSTAGSLGAGTITLASGTALDLGGNSQTSGLLSSTAANSVVTNSGSSNAVLTLSSTGSATFAGGILAGATNTIGITKAGTGNQILSGSSSFVGPTTINAGKLTLSPTGTLGNTAITVNSGGTFAPQTGSNAGSTGAGSLGASLILSSGTGSNLGGTFSMVDGTIGVFNLNQQTSFSGPALTLGGSGTSSNSPLLSFEIGSSSADELVVSTGAISIGSSGANVAISALSGVTSLTPGSYTLISAPGGGLAPLTLSSSSILVGSQVYAFSLAGSTSTAEILTVSTNNNTPLNAYFTGANGTSWSATGPTNFATDHTGATATSGPPGGVTNVFLTADNANSGNLSTTLDAAFNINSLTFTGTGTTAATTSVTVAAGNGGSLTLTPTTAFNTSAGTRYGPGTGLLVQAGSAAHFISAPVILGSSQTWEIDNAPANGLTVSGSITDAGLGFLLNKTGTGTLILSATNTYSGGTNISAGILQTTAVGALPINAPLTINGGTLDMAGISQTVTTLSDGGVSTGSIINTGAAATFNVNGSTGSTFSGSFNAGASTLTLNGPGPVTLSGASTLQYLNVYGGTATLTATGSIAPGTAGDVNIGDNGNFSVTGGTITTAALYTGSKGTSATLIGPGSIINVTGVLGLDNDNGAGGASFLQNSGGVINVGSITIGRNGGSTGTAIVTTGLTGEGLYMTSGTINDAGTFYVGTAAATNSNADMRMDGGVFNVSGATIITDVGNTRLSTVDISGGTFNATTVQLGGNIGTTAGQSGELLIRGTGVANVSGIIFGNSTQTSGSDVLELLGGSLYVGAGGLVNTTTSITPTVNLGGTTFATAPVLAASAPWSSSVLITLTNSSSGVAPIIQAANASGGANNITLTGFLEGNGGLTKTGAGTLFLTNGNGYFGITSINAGILNINGQFALGGADYGGTTFNGGTLQFVAGSFPTNANGTGDITQNSTGTAKPVLINAAGATIDLNGNPVAFAYPVTGAGALTLLDSSGTGASLTLSGANTYAGNTNVASGTVTLTVASTGSLASTTNLINTGTVNLQNPTQTIASLSGTGNLNLSSSALKISTHTGTPLANTTGSLSLSGAASSWTSSVDLTNNALIIHNGSIGTVTNQVDQGYNGGNWNGTGGILSSTAAANTSHLTALGAILNDNGTGTSHALYTIFEGVPSVEGDVLVKYTYYGDTDLNGSVDGTDYSRIDNAYTVNQTATSPLTGWFNGDFNYDGLINGSDYTLMDNAFNQQSTVYSSQVASPTALVSGGSAVPEPASLGLLGIGAVGLLGRRNRRRN